MKKLLTGVILACVASSSFAQFTPTQADYDKFHQEINNIFPTMLYFASLDFYGQRLRSAYESDVPLQVANPLAPRFAKCLQSSLDDKIYDKVIKESINSYLLSVTNNEFQNDLANVLSSPDNKFRVAIYNDALKIYANNTTLKENQTINSKKSDQVFAYLDSSEFQNFKKSHPNSNKPSLIFENFFGLQSSLAKSMHTQYDHCQNILISNQK